jgi:hypothetical protein
MVGTCEMPKMHRYLNDVQVTLYGCRRCRHFRPELGDPSLFSSPIRPCSAFEKGENP